MYFIFPDELIHVVINMQLIFSISWCFRYVKQQIHNLLHEYRKPLIFALRFFFQPRIRHKLALDLDMLPEAVNPVNQQSLEEEMKKRRGKRHAYTTKFLSWVGSEGLHD